MSHESLSASEAERLEMLAEEAAEVVQVCMKILRHGYASYHPNSPEVTNRMLLEDELRDLDAVRLAMMRRADIGKHGTVAIMDAWTRKLTYAHHQQEIPTEDDKAFVPEWEQVDSMGSDAMDEEAERRRDTALRRGGSVID
jgi:hypothetical protein